MTTAQSELPNSAKPLRLWPGVVAALVLSLALYGVPFVAPDLAMYSFMIGGPFGLLSFIIWWAFFSRAPHLERWGALVLMIAVLYATTFILHKSVATGAMGMMYFFYAIPSLIIAFVAWAMVSRRLSVGTRRVAMVATILLACGVWTLVRTDGMTGEGGAQFAWRWSATPEERLLAQGGDLPAAAPSTQAAAETPGVQPATGVKPAAAPSIPAAAGTTGEPPFARAEDKAAASLKIGNVWPGFRGPDRDGKVRGTQIKTDWTASPPVELWHRSIGPGWSSFAVRGDLFYTQEQRGNDEIVVCYNLTTGKPVWRHRDTARFWESNAGPGPRGTPTIDKGRVYTFGATGILNVLDAGNGALIWSRNAASDTGTKVPTWGFASSPLVVNDIVIVAAAGNLVAYDLANGKPRWFGPVEKSGGYSSPHLATIDGVAQILLINGAGAISVALADGARLWEHKWSGDGIVQPALTVDGDVLIGSGSGLDNVGMQRVSLEHGPGGWTARERWTSNGLKPYYNDFVVHKNHAFGFDGSILACVDLNDGKRKWKGGRFGHGQLVLLPDQDLLLVLSEEGELALVAATTDKFTEIAAPVQAIKGKTWNHPALAGDVLLVRNDQEMAAFRLSLAGR